MKKMTFLMIIACMVISTALYGVEPKNFISLNDDSISTISSGSELKTLLNTNVQSGGYLSISTQYKAIDGEESLVIGGRIGWLINHCFTIGLGGYGFFSNPKTDTFLINTITDLDPNDEFGYSGGWGGVFFEPVFFPRFPVHVAVPVMIGAGGVGYSSWNGNDYDESDSWDNYQQDNQGFFIVNPGVEIELNMMKFLRLNFGAYYQWTSDIDLTYRENFAPIAGNDLLRGFSYGMTIKVGYF
jgi:hypothetical protein